jgi:hypothetical protein
VELANVLVINMFKGTVRIPIVKKKVPKRWAIVGAAALAVILFYYFKRKNQAVDDDIAQLVISAPKPGQVSITNPSVVRRSNPKPKPRVVSHAGGSPVPPGGEPANRVFSQGASSVGQTAGILLAAEQQGILERAHALTHPHFAPHAVVHFDPNEIKNPIVEGLKSCKIAGVG